MKATKYSFLIILQVVCLTGNAQESIDNKVYGLPFIQNYTPEDYGSNGRNWGIVQDSLGIIYVANTNGILTFDGSNWGEIETANGKQAKSIGIDGEGKIFVGGYDDFGYLKLDSLGGVRFQSLLELVPEDSRGFQDVWSTQCTKDGVFFQANDFIFRYANDSVQVLPKSARLFHTSWTVRGQFYVRQHGLGIQTFEDDKLQFVEGTELYAKQVARTLLPLGDDDFWLSESSGKIQSLIDGELSMESEFIKNIQKSTGVAFMISGRQLQDGGFVLNSLGEGSFIFDSSGNLQYHLTKKKGIVDNTANETLIDKDNNLWIATGAGISHILLNHGMTFAGDEFGVDRKVNDAILKGDQLHLATVTGIFEEVDGSFEWIYETGIETFDMEIVQGKLYGIFESYVAEVTPDGQKKYVGGNWPLWRMIALKNSPGYYISGVYNRGLILYQDNGKELVEVTKIGGYRGNAANIVEDSDGNLWVSDGSMKIDRVTLNSELDSVVQINTYGIAHGLSKDEGNHVLPFVSENEPTPLFASGDSYYEFISEKDTFIIYEPLKDLAKGGKGLPFLQTTNGDIYTYSGGKPVRYLYEDEAFQADTLSLLKLKSRAQKIVEIQPGNLIFCTSKGLIQLRESIETNPSGSTFRTLVRKVTSSEFLLHGGITNTNSFEDQIRKLQYENNSLRFTFSSTYYDNPELTQYQYRLEGYEDEWSEWTEARYKEYTNLNEGKYTFSVRAKNQYQKIGSTDSFSFYIIPPWYRSSLSYATYLGVLIMIIWGLIRLNTRRLEAENRKLEKVVTERTEEIEKQKEELKSKNQQLIELDQFKQDMTSMVVHDLKNPLGAIIQKGEAKTSSIARKMLNLVLNILDVQKFEEASIELDRQEISFSKLLENAMEEVRESINEKNLSIKIEGASSIVNVDVELIERVLINFLTNAIKYSPMNAELKAQIVLENNLLRFSLEDNGPGIPVEKQSIIFDRYIQVDKTKATRIKSTGLGLTFCKMAIEAHGGQVGVTSSEGEGAIFWFTLPATQQMEEVINLKSEPSINKLTEEEKRNFKAILPELVELKIYQGTEIETLLRGLSVEDNSGIARLIDKIIDAAYTMNEELYNHLLNDWENQ